MAPSSASPPTNHRAFIAAAVVAGLFLATFGSVNAATVTVASINFRFEPETRSVNIGDTVRWTFAGDPHTVTSGAPGAPDGRFDSGIKDAGTTYQVTFDSLGTFPYFCEIHPEQMFGTVVVEAGTPTQPPAPTATPRPTARPTTRPTAAPTARPTAAPTARPTAAPTARPTATAGASPTESAEVTPTATAPSPSLSSGAPTVSPSAAASASAPAASAAPSASADVSPPPEDGAAAASVDLLPIVALGIVVGVLVAGGVTLMRRRTGA